MRKVVLVCGAEWSSALEAAGVPGLEDDLHEFLGDAGEALGSGVGCGLWSVDLALNDGVSPEIWVDRLVGYLREWGAPPDTQVRVGLENPTAVFPCEP